MTTLPQTTFGRLGLADIVDKVYGLERLSLEDGERLFHCPDPVAVGQLAHWVRTRKHGLRTTYVLNRQMNYTNICVNHCLFCAYYRQKGEAEAFELSLADVEHKLAEASTSSLSEIHIVGGCHPELPLSYYLELLRRVQSLVPQATLKCFTPVEISHFAHRERMNYRDILIRLKEAGLEMLPGGGAEIFAPEVRRKICPGKIDGETWLEVCRIAHGLGLKTNCTMLFGHLETVRHRLEHLDSLRRLQDETGGFVCFIPLPFLTKHSRLQGISPLTGIEELQTIAVSRLMLDNIDHIKSYWIMLGLKQAQTALYFGADDLDGTVVEEKIGHMAGAGSPQVLSRAELTAMIEGCGLSPVQRDGLFRPLEER